MCEVPRRPDPVGGWIPSRPDSVLRDGPEETGSDTGSRSDRGGPGVGETWDLRPLSGGVVEGASLFQFTSSGVPQHPRVSGTTSPEDETGTGRTVSPPPVSVGVSVVGRRVSSSRAVVTTPPVLPCPNTLHRGDRFWEWTRCGRDGSGSDPRGRRL